MNKKWDSSWQWVAASLMALGMAAPMQATAIATFTDRTAWQSSLIGVTTANFEETLASGIYETYNTSGGFTSGVMQFIGILGGAPESYSLKRVENPYSQTGRYLITPTYAGGYDSRVVINISNAAKAFGLDIASGIEGLSFQIVIGAETFNVQAPTAGNTRAFFGVHSDTALTQIVLRMTGSGPPFPVNSTSEGIVDDVSVGFLSGGGGGGAVPEPSTVFFSLTGIGLLAWTRRRQFSSLIKN